MDTNTATKPPVGRMKGRAPPPPPVPQPAPRRLLPGTRNAVPDGGVPQCSVESIENVLQPTVELLITLPGGFQTSGDVNGRSGGQPIAGKALMDLLVELCARYHLNPAHHTLDLLSAEGRPLAYKPNALLGALDVQHAIIREKVTDEKAARKLPPKVPEKSVRLVVNYHGSQKAVLRVSPLVPLRSLVPAICEKCEFDPNHVILLKDNVSNHEMDLEMSLTELGIRELYVLDQKLVLQPKMASTSTPALNSTESVRSSRLSNYSTDRKGLLGLFSFNKRKSKDSAAPTNPCVEARPSTLGQSQSVMNISKTSPKAEVKKRRAPPPPQATPTMSETQGSVDTFQRKRKAPPPPPTPVPSMPAEDSMSELSHSTEASEPAGSMCSSSSLENPDSSKVPATSMPDDTGSAHSLRMEEGTNHRNSGIDAGCSVPPKPRRTPTRDPPTLFIPPPPHFTPPPTDIHQDRHHAVQEEHQPRFGSLKDDVLEERPEPESVSSDSSSSSPDQGYAPSEGMVEDSVFISSLPSPIPGKAKHSDSESDEGCATWTSRHRHGKEIYSLEHTDGRDDSYEEDPDISAQIHKTLDDLDADLADIDHSEQASLSGASLTSSETSYHGGIPVSVLDSEVPVTAINEVGEEQLLDYWAEIQPYKPHSFVQAKKEDIHTSGSFIKVDTVLQQREKSSSSEKSANSQEETSAIPVTEIGESTWNEDIKQDEIPLVKEPTKIQQSNQPSDKDKCPVRRHTGQSKITHSATSRFGLTTFTIIPPKPALAQTHKPTGSLVSGAIRIDELGNMMVRGGTEKENSGTSARSKSDSEASLLEKAKAFWSSAEQPDVGDIHNKGAAVKPNDSEGAKLSPEEKKVQPEELPKETLVHTKVDTYGVNRKTSISESIVNQTKPVPEPPQKRDLTFLRPSRRTSSQYIASAISKYTRKPTDGVENTYECYARSAYIPRQNSSSRSFLGGSLSINTETESTKTINKSFSSADSTDRPLLQRQSSNQEPNSPTSPDAFVMRSPPNQPPANSTKETSQAVEKPEPPLSPSALLETGQGMFGPVKKVKPVVLKPVQKDLSLHSCLMEAIQSGDGRERLRKIPNTDGGNPGKPVSYVPAENERSALLAAIRVQSSSLQLKKTQSEAANELNELRKVEVESTRRPGALLPPPPPPSPSHPPSHMLPVQTQARVSRHQGGMVDAENARDALLEAIRSGAGAQRLRKVPVPTKTVLVNGRLGTIKTSVSNAQGH